MRYSSGQVNFSLLCKFPRRELIHLHYISSLLLEIFYFNLKKVIYLFIFNYCTET